MLSRVFHLFGALHAPRRAVVLQAALCALGLGALTAHAAFTARSAAQHRRARAFSMTGRLSTVLRPGVQGRLALRLDNAHRYPLWVTSVTVALVVDRRQRAAGCASADYVIRQVPRSAFPIFLAPRRGRALAVPQRPVLGMRARDVSQDACRGATLRLVFTGRAQIHRPAPARARGRS